MATGNAINANQTGIQTFTGTAFTGSTVTQHGVLVGGASNAVSSTAVGSTGQVLQGVSAGDPTYSTATYPSVATGTGTILRADGTNWVATTSTYPNTNAINTLLYASSANVMAALPTANSSMLVTDSSGVPTLASSLIGDFTFTSSTAGTLRTLTVSNTNNSNTASQARIQTTVGGASAGDPFSTYTITGATSFSLGLDNSDSDAFVISASTALGTTNVMRAQVTGEINYPLQTAFMAYLATSDLNKTGTGGSFTIGTGNALTKVFDQNSDFNTNGTFTAPVTGRYQLSAITQITGCTNANATVVNIITSNRNYTNNRGTVSSAADQSNICSFLCDMDAADTATVAIASFGEAGATDDIAANATNVVTGISGFLAC